MTDQKQLIKATFNGDTRRIRLTSSKPYDELTSAVASAFDDISGFRLTYLDEDEDLVTIGNESDLLYSLEEAKSQGKTLKVKVEKIAFNGSVVDQKAIVKTESPTSNDEKSPVKEWVKVQDNAANEIETKVAKETAAGLKPTSKPASKAEPKAEQPIEIKSHDDKGKDAKKKDDKEGKKTKREERKQERQEWQKAREEFRDELKDLFGDEKVVTALQDALPTVIELLLSGTELKTVLDAIVESSPVLKENETVQKIVGSLDNILQMFPCMGSMNAGPFLVDILLEAQNLSLGKDTGKGCPGRKLIRMIRFFKRLLGRGGRRDCKEVHYGISCDKSGMSPIVGPRWNKKGHNYDLCDEEYKKLSDDEKKAFRRVKARRGCGPMGGRGCGSMGGMPFFMNPNMFGSRGACPFGAGGPSPFGAAFGSSAQGNNPFAALAQAFGGTQQGGNPFEAFAQAFGGAQRNCGGTQENEPAA